MSRKRPLTLGNYDCEVENYQVSKMDSLPIFVASLTILMANIAFTSQSVRVNGPNIGKNSLVKFLGIEGKLNCANVFIFIRKGASLEYF